MRLKGMPECYLCDTCGQIGNIEDVYARESEKEFCSANCAFRRTSSAGKHLCWVCARKLEEPVSFHWWTIVSAKYLPVFCSLDCRQKYKEHESEEEFKLGRCGNCQHWEQVARNAKILGNIGQCQKISVLKRVPDGFEWVDPITGDSFGCIQFEPREEE